MLCFLLPSAGWLGHFLSVLPTQVKTFNQVPRFDFEREEAVGTQAPILIRLESPLNTILELDSPELTEPLEMLRAAM